MILLTSTRGRILIMMTDPSQNFVEILKIVGHSEEEAKKLNENFMTMVVQRSILLLSSKLGQDKVKELKQMIEDGMRGQEVITFIAGVRGDDEVKKIISGSVAYLIDKYMKEVSPKLDEEKKKKLAEYLLGSN